MEQSNMNLKDVREWAVLIVGFVLDLPQFLRSPREFIQHANHESEFRTCLRLLSYAILFDLCCDLLFAFRTFPTLSPWQLFLIGLFELLLALFSVPFFALANRITRAGGKIKEIVVYCVVFKFIWLLPVVVMYSLYLFSEDHLFLWPRGVLYWFGLVSLPLLWPFLVNQGLRRRTVTCLLSLVFLYSASFAIGYTVYRSDTARQRIVKVSLLYDPITAEFRRLTRDADYVLSTKALTEAMDRFTDSIERRGMTLVVHREKYRLAIEDIGRYGGTLGQEAAGNVKRLKAYISTARFNRNREAAFLALRVSESLLQLSSDAKEMKGDDITRALKQAARLYRETGSVLRESYAYLQVLHRQNNLLIRLARYGMILW